MRRLRHLQSFLWLSYFQVLVDKVNLTVGSAERAKDPEELINLAISWEERVLSELKNC